MRASPVRRVQEERQGSRLPLGIRLLWCEPPDSVGGVSVLIRFVNLGDKTIKYARFQVVSYNEVGDVVASEIGNRHEVNLEYTGPAQPGKDCQGAWASVWYNSTIHRPHIVGVTVEYMDGSSATVKAEQIQSLFVEPRMNQERCKLFVYSLGSW